MSRRFYTKDLAAWGEQAQPGQGMVGMADLCATRLIDEPRDSKTLAIGRLGLAS